MTDGESIIVGAGPGRARAALYAGRAMLRTAVLERGVPGGELLNTEWIDDYPGSSTILGRELAAKMSDHAQAVRCRASGTENVEGIARRADGTFEVDHEERHRLRGAGGDRDGRRHAAQARHAGRAGIRRPRGVLLRGVRRRVLQGRDVAVVGGGDAAVRGGGLPHPLRREGVRDPPARRRSAPPRSCRSASSTIRRSRSVWNTVAEEGLGTRGGGDRGAAARCRNRRDAASSTANGLFVFIGFKPNTGMIAGAFEHDATGYVDHRPGRCTRRFPGSSPPATCGRSSPAR